MKSMVAGLVLASLSVPAHAEVVQADERGFVVSGSTTVTGVDAQGAWAQLVEPANWWSSDHSWSGDAQNMWLVPAVDGCFCEALPNAQNAEQVGSAEHMRVIHAVPGQLLRMRGSLGPLQSEALTGVLTIELEEVQLSGLPSRDIETGVTISWSYIVGGYARFPLAEIAPAVDGVMAEQMQRFADHLLYRLED